MAQGLLYLAGCERTNVALFRELFMYDFIEDVLVLMYRRVIRWGKSLR